MRRFDVCNGDADGLCAVRQWRLYEPAEATLVTGLKREIELLERVPAQAGDEVLVCDLSMQRNHAALLALLERGVRVRYFDHHHAGAVPEHPALEAHLDHGDDTCTSLLVDRHLGGAWRRWALVGAYGDNLTDVADALGSASELDVGALAGLRQLGEAVNYNAYGEQASDVHIAPEELYRLLARHDDPLEVLSQEPVVRQLDALRRGDLVQALRVPPHRQGPDGSMHLLPDEPWSRRVSGTLANELARRDPDRAHAVLRRTGTGALQVSLRAPLSAPRGADALARRFGGNGRAAAAGIDELSEDRLDEFVAAFDSVVWGAA